MNTIKNSVDFTADNGRYAPGGYKTKDGYKFFSLHLTFPVIYNRIYQHGFYSNDHTHALTELSLEQVQELHDRTAEILSTSMTRSKFIPVLSCSMPGDTADSVHIVRRHHPILNYKQSQNVLHILQANYNSFGECTFGVIADYVSELTTDSLMKELAQVCQPELTLNYFDKMLDYLEKYQPVKV